MNEEEPGAASSGTMRQSRWTRPRPRWLDVGVPALLVLAVAIPTMAVEEDWHGRPMIEQPGLLWLAAAFLVAGAFLVGGMAAGYRRPSAPARHATVAADLAVGVLLVGAVSRRLWLAHKGVPFAVVRLWCLGAVAALLLSAAGSQLGRWLAVRALSPLLARGKSDPAPPDDSRWWR